MNDDERQGDGRHRPSWLLEDCPSWCTAQHREDDHPEDRRHVDAGHAFGVVMGKVDPDTLTTETVADDLVVQRFAEIPNGRTWVSIRSAESAFGALVLSVESAEALNSSLALLLA